MFKHVLTAALLIISISASALADTAPLSVNSQGTYLINNPNLTVICLLSGSQSVSGSAASWVPWQRLTRTATTQPAISCWHLAGCSQWPVV